MHRIPRLIAVLTAFVCAPGFAAETSDPPWYEFEVIVFQHNSQAGMQSEAWRDSPPPQHLGGAIDPYVRQPDFTGFNTTAGQALELLPTSEYQLVDSYSRLDRSPRYTPLIHLGWRQPVFNDQQASYIRLHTNEPPQGSSTSSPGFLQDRQIALHRLDGTIRLSINRYLHADMDLSLMNSGNTKRFNLVESRRIRSNELHYFDHPVFGVLLTARPYEKAEAATSP